MIALLRGEVALRRPDQVVVLCGGVGYRALISAQTFAHVPAVGAQVTLHTQLVVRDDTISLYGFHCEEERDLFMLLLTVPAVGPKVALSILSQGPVRKLVGAIAAGEHTLFLAAPGVGRRTAERLVAELRERVGSFACEVVPRSAGGAAKVPAEDPLALAREGLLELGFTPFEAGSLLAGASGESAQELLRAALQNARRAS